MKLNFKEILKEMDIKKMSGKNPKTILVQKHTSLIKTRKLTFIPMEIAPGIISLVISLALGK